MPGKVRYKFGHMTRQQLIEYCRLRYEDLGLESPLPLHLLVPVVPDYGASPLFLYFPYTN